MPGTILDTDYRLREEASGVVVSVTKVATGPMTAEEAAGVARFGDLTLTFPRSRSSPPAETPRRSDARPAQQDGHRQQVSCVEDRDSW
jgi:hypothetical protein